MDRRRALLATFMVIVLTAGTVWAANPPPSQTQSADLTNQLTGVAMSDKLRFVMWVTLAIIGFGTLVLAGITAVFWRSVGRKSDEFVRLYAISLVVVASLVLIVAGYADSQIAPAFGLFGSIIGYLFGRGEAARPPPPADQAQPGNGAPGG